MKNTSEENTYTTHTQEYQIASLKIELDMSDFVSASDV